MFKTKAKTICGANIAKVTLSLDVQKKKKGKEVSAKYGWSWWGLITLGTFFC